MNSEHVRTHAFSPVTHVASKHLGEAVAPEEATQHHAGLPLAPAELLCHADGADGHRHAGAVQEAGPQQQHHRPYPRHRPASENHLNLAAHPPTDGDKLWTCQTS